MYLHNARQSEWTFDTSVHHWMCVAQPAYRGLVAFLGADRALDAGAGGVGALRHGGTQDH